MALRIAVLGNCQAVTLARRLERLCPQAEVITVSWARVASPERAEAIADEVVRCDVVLTQPLDKPAYGPLRSDSLIGRAAGRVQLWPRLYFTGLHPDVVSADKSQGLGAPFGSNHSALIMAGYALGFGPARTAELFNAYAYGVLGYFDEFAKAEAFMADSARAVGLEFRPLLDRWRGRVSFHVPHHPVAALIEDLAVLLCDALGLSRQVAAEPTRDAFANYRNEWPVYPEIARRLGMEGSLVFRRHAAPREIDLEQTIALFHEGYAVAGRADVGRFVRPAMETLRAEGF